MKLMQDELAAESATNIEFEESSRRSFEFLTGQVRALKGAFSKLSDTLLEELEHLSNSLRSDLWQLEQRQNPLEMRQGAIEQLQGAIEQQLGERVAAIEQRQALLERSIEQHLQQHFQVQKEAQKEIQKAFNASLDDLRQVDEQGREQLSEAASRSEQRLEQLALDMDTVLGVIPEIEETLRGSDSLLQEKIANVVMDVAKVNEVVVKERTKAATSLERVEAKIQAAKADLHEELEQRHMKLQRNLTKQLDTMSRALLQDERRPREAPGLGSTAPRSTDVFGLPAGGNGLAPVIEGGVAQHAAYRQLDFDLSAVESPRPEPDPAASASTPLHAATSAFVM